MREYYEDLWERLPAHLDPPDLDLRASFLLAHVAAGQRVLDLGCGDGVFTALIGQRAGVRVTAADVAQAALDRVAAREGIAAREDPVTLTLVPFDGPLPFDDNSFDLVWASEVIEHVADTARWLSEVRRVLRPGGTLLLTTPNHSRLRLAIRGIAAYSPPLGDHLHLYNRASLTTLLEEFGFDPVRVVARGSPGPLSAVLTAHAQR